MKWLYTSNTSLLQLLIAQIQKPFKALAKPKGTETAKEESQENQTSSRFEMLPPKIAEINPKQMRNLIQLSIQSACAEYEKSAMAVAFCKKMNLPESVYIKHKNNLNSAAKKWAFLTGESLIDELLKDLKISKP